MINEERYRVVWEMITPFTNEWRESSNEGNEQSALDQYRQLQEWARTGEEPVRNVHLYKLTITGAEIWPPPMAS